MILKGSDLDCFDKFENRTIGPPFCHTFGFQMVLFSNSWEQDWPIENRTIKILNLEMFGI